ncbi:MAG: hypothetical protein M0P70_14165 [Desulfobulbaceae bacterium]|nr:hypothetical protein [Desulfobulbaceae bacterium]
MERTLDAGIHTRDIAVDPNKVVNTAEMGDAIVKNLLNG